MEYKEGYQPTSSNLDKNDPPQSGSGIPMHPHEKLGRLKTLITHLNCQWDHIKIHNTKETVDHFEDVLKQLVEVSNAT